MGFHKRWFPRGVRSDVGYAVAFVGSVPRGRKLRYLEGNRSVACIGEQTLILAGTRRKWGLHFALDPQHLTEWDEGSVVRVTEVLKVSESNGDDSPTELLFESTQPKGQASN